MKARLLGMSLALAWLPMGSIAASEPPSSVPSSATWPTQVWLRVPYEPTVFVSGKDQHLLYELYLTNVSQQTVMVTGVDVVDAADAQSHALAHFEGATLDAVAQSLGDRKLSPDTGSSHPIVAGETLTLFLEVVVPRDRVVPRQFLHRITLQGSTITGASIGTHHDALKVLGRPVKGADWRATDGPGNDPENHHRRGIFVIDGRLTDSRRLAIDWKVVKDGVSFHGDEHVTRSYFAYGKPILAVADGTVVMASDGMPDNPPGHGAAFHPAVPTTFDNVGGNYVVLDVGNGQFAHYFHMQPGSLRVRTGDRVHRGQVIGAIGSSGDAREPHVHLELTTSPRPLAGEGIPYLIERYRVVKSSDGVIGERRDELPLDGSMIDFGD